MADLAEQLKAVLGIQLGLYREIGLLQTDLLKRLDDTNQLSVVMELLARKNSLLDAIRSENHRASPLVDEWVRSKDEMIRSSAYPEIEAMLGEIEGLVIQLRGQDEEMIRRFEGMARPAATEKDQQAHSRNMLNAFRALR